MGIYGALTTAVTGMAAQSFALENISGNIANSQTTGYKRMETGFIDLIPDAAVGRQKPGAVLAYSRSTNNVRGDIITSPTGTHVALSGGGLFVVAEKIGTSDGQSLFSDTNYYTRRGDFEMDREGYLRNGAGYYLKGVPIQDGNVAGSVPETIKIGNGLVPAQKTSRINYEVNLPAVPANDVGFLADFATRVSAGGMEAGDGLGWSEGDTFAVTVSGTTYTFTEGADEDTTVQGLLDWVRATVPGVNARLSEDGALEIVGTHPSQSIAVSGAGATALGMPSGTSTGSIPNGQELYERTVEGGSRTLYGPNGASANVLLRWGKISDQPDTWQLFYNSEGAGQEWTQVPDAEFTFAENGRLQTKGGVAVASGESVSVNIPNLTINGVQIGSVDINFGADGLTQYDNANGRARVTTIEQDGFPAGEFMSVAVNDSGRVVATYSNGKQIEIFQLVTANFNAENMLKRLDGGVYTSTAESGEAVFSTDGGVIGGALESSNTDISEEFTKLIVTQQAYAAGTRIVSTSNEMLREALSMLR